MEHQNRQSLFTLHQAK